MRSLTNQTVKTNLITLIASLFILLTPVFSGNVHAKDSLWVANSGSNDVSRINTETDTVEANIPVGEFPCAVAVSKTHVFIANRNGKSISIIDKVNNTEEYRIELDRHPQSLALGADNYLYVVVSVNTIDYTQPI